MISSVSLLNFYFQPNWTLENVTRWLFHQLLWANQWKCSNVIAQMCLVKWNVKWNSKKLRNFVLLGRREFCISQATDARENAAAAVANKVDTGKIFSPRRRKLCKSTTTLCTGESVLKITGGKRKLPKISKYLNNLKNN